jgi:hypothetical protein
MNYCYSSQIIALAQKVGWAALERCSKTRQGILTRMVRAPGDDILDKACLKARF